MGEQAMGVANSRQDAWIGEEMVDAGIRRTLTGGDPDYAAHLQKFSSVLSAVDDLSIPQAQVLELRNDLGDVLKKATDYIEVASMSAESASKPAAEGDVMLDLLPRESNQDLFASQHTSGVHKRNLLAATDASFKNALPTTRTDAAVPIWSVAGLVAFVVVAVVFTVVRKSRRARTLCAPADP